MFYCALVFIAHKLLFLLKSVAGCCRTRRERNWLKHVEKKPKQTWKIRVTLWNVYMVIFILKLFQTADLTETKLFVTTANFNLVLTHFIVKYSDRQK